MIPTRRDLLVGAAALAGAARCRAAQDPQFRRRIRMEPTHAFEATLEAVLTYRPQGDVGWRAFALGPAEVDGIRGGSVALEAWVGDSRTPVAGNPGVEGSTLRRPFVAADLAAGSVDTLRIKATYRGTLVSRRLEPGRPADAPAALAANRREAFIASTQTMNHADPAFRAWLKGAGLLRRDGERDIDFAYRVWRTIMERFRYGGKVASPLQVCTRGESDCGGLSMAFAAALRANGVPARTLWGRWALPKTDDYGQWHVKAEFYADGIGWVPVEPAGALTWNPRDKDEWFGQDAGNFIPFHVDTDLRMPLGARVAEAPWSQFLLYWTTRGGISDLQGTDVWKVRLAEPRR